MIPIYVAGAVLTAVVLYIRDRGTFEEAKEVGLYAGFILLWPLFLLLSVGMHIYYAIARARSRRKPYV